MTAAETGAEIGVQTEAQIAKQQDFQEIGSSEIGAGGLNACVSIYELPHR